MHTDQATNYRDYRAYIYTYPDRNTLVLLNTMLDEGMSSRLFLNIREGLGLAFDVHSFTQKHRDTGYLGVYIGVDPKQAVDAGQPVVGELRRLGGAEGSAGDPARAEWVTKCGGGREPGSSRRGGF